MQYDIYHNRKMLKKVCKTIATVISKLKNNV